MATKSKPIKSQPQPQSKPQFVDDRALEFKVSILNHLNTLAAIMTEAAKDGIEVSFNVTRTEKGEFEPTNVGLIRRY